MPPTARPSPSNTTKKGKSGIPLKDSSKTITKRQTKLPTALSRLEDATASPSSSKTSTSGHQNPINLRFGGTKASAAASKAKTDTKTQPVEKKTPEVIDIDLDSEDEDKSENQPQTKSTASKEAPPMASSGSTKKTTKKPPSEIDWKSRCFVAEKQLQELNEKIPPMIKEFNKCLDNKENILGKKDQKLKECQTAMKEKDDIIAKLEAENKANVKNRNADAVMKNENFKKEIAVKVKEISHLKEKLQDSVNAGKKRQEEFREKNKECSEKTKLIMELEGLKPKLKLQVEVISKLEKEKDERMEKIEDLNKEMKSQSIREQDYRVRIGKLKEETEGCKNKVSEMKSRMAILDADLSLHYNLLEEKDEEIKVWKENLEKLKNEKESLESNLKKTEDEKGSLQSQLKVTKTELNSAKESLATLATIQNKMRSLMKTTETQKEIIENQKVALENYRRQADEMAKKKKDQNLKIQLANESNSKLNNENKVQTERIKKVTEQNDQLQMILNNEVEHNKKTQDMLCGQLNALEVQNFNKKEVIVQLEAEVKSLKEEMKGSLQFVSLQKASEDYMKLVRRRQLQHLTHQFCSQVEQEDVTQEGGDPVTLDEVDEEPMLVVDTSYEEEEEEEIIYIGENPSPDTEVDEVIMEDIDEDSSCPPAPSCQEVEISYPNNMLTYLWPCLPRAKNQEEENTDVLLQTPEVSTVRISGPEKPRIFLSVCPATKRKAVDIVARPSKRRRPTEEIIRISEPSPTLAITYNWPVMIYQGNLLSQRWTGWGRRGTKRSRESQDEGTKSANKRIKLDLNAYYFPGPSPSLVLLRQDLLAQLRIVSSTTSQYILDDLLTEALSVSQQCRQQENRGVVGSLIENILEIVVQQRQPFLEEDEVNWPLVPYQPGRLNPPNAPVEVNLEVTAISSTDHNPVVEVVEDVLEEILLTIVSDNEEDVQPDFPTGSSSENSKRSTVEKGETFLQDMLEDNGGQICQELIRDVLESERFQETTVQVGSENILMFYFNEIQLWQEGDGSRSGLSSGNLENAGNDKDPVYGFIKVCYIYTLHIREGRCQSRKKNCEKFSLHFWTNQAI